MKASLDAEISIWIRNYEQQRVRSDHCFDSQTPSLGASQATSRGNRRMPGSWSHRGLWLQPILSIPTAFTTLTRQNTICACVLLQVATFFSLSEWAVLQQNNLNLTNPRITPWGSFLRWCPWRMMMRAFFQHPRYGRVWRTFGLAAPSQKP